MSNYAIVAGSGMIVNMIIRDGEDDLWTPGEGFLSVKAEETWVIGGTFVDGKYTAPVPEKPSDSELMAINIQTKLALMMQASERVSILQDAVDLDMATDLEKENIILWKRYRVILSRIDANLSSSVSWPKEPVF